MMTTVDTSSMRLETMDKPSSNDLATIPSWESGTWSWNILLSRTTKSTIQEIFSGRPLGEKKSFIFVSA